MILDKINFARWIVGQCIALIFAYEWYLTEFKSTELFFYTAAYMRLVDITYDLNK